ncbi:OsmC family protein [Candidatus Saccharibacteria bacterium]|nr:OsmC family protein [Candidatus Saccharibacteria bacterium]
MDTLTVKMQTIDKKSMFSATARDNPEIIIDYFPPVGTGNGYTSLELFMASLGSCVSTTILSLLRYRMKKKVDGVVAEIEGTVRKEHPKALQHILLTLKFKSKELSNAEAMEALKAAEDKLCPVWSMIKGNVDVDVKIEICE